jgi:ketosteroid isomerase-like protein/ribosomal protein S18 acetylase RimI-like enzyme
MPAQNHAESVRKAFSDLSAGNAATLLDLLAPDVVYTTIGSTKLSGVWHGRDVFVRNVAAPVGAALLTPLEMRVDRIVADGDCVVAQVRGKATLRSGAPYDNQYCFVFRFAGTRVAELTEYFDTALTARAFAVPADRTALLRSMDLNMWEMFREIVRLGRGSELVEMPQAWMGWSSAGTPFHNMVAVRDVIDADALLAAIRTVYTSRGRLFSIWTRAHADMALEDELRRRGFTVFTTMPGMALLGDPGTRSEPPGLEIRPATTDRERRDFLQVSAEAYATYGAPPAYAEDAFVSLESVCAPHVQGFVGYCDGRPVAAAAVYVTHGVAGIGWVGTIESARRRGYAEALTWAAVREGFRRGAAFANLQASVMGRPIYERMGFLTLTEYRVLIGPV